MKIVKDSWGYDRREQDFEQAVQEEIADMSAFKSQSLLADMLLLLVAKKTLTPAEVITLLGVDWEVPG